MKKTHICLILLSGFLFGCATGGPKLSSVTKPKVAPPGLSSAEWLDQYQISLETGLHYHAPALADDSAPHQSNMAVSLADYNRRDFNLSNGTGTNSFEQYWGLLKMIPHYDIHLVINGSPPHQSQIDVSSGVRTGLDCRGRDMSLVDDTATK